MSNDIYLIKRLSNLKIPLWITFFPIIGNLVFSTIYKSWMFGFNNINLFWKKYRKMVLRTSGVWVLSLICYVMFSSIFWIIILINDYNFDFLLPLFIGISLFILFFNLIYQPINLFFEPKKIFKEYNFDNLNLNTIDLNDDYEIYKFQDCIYNLKHNLFKLSYFCLFSNLQEIKNKWILSARNKYDNLAKTNIISREFGQNNICISHFKYLFTTGIWYFGIIFLIFKIFNKNNKLVNKTKKIGTKFTLFFWLLNFLFILILCLIYFFTNVDYILFYFLPFELFIINIVYINLIGFILSCYIKKELLKLKVN